eukprot:3066990-Pleurochrysis_carterae.AAC.1
MDKQVASSRVQCGSARRGENGVMRAGTMPRRGTSPRMARDEPQNGEGRAPEWRGTSRAHRCLCVRVDVRPRVAVRVHVDMGAGVDEGASAMATYACAAAFRARTAS